MPFLQSRKIRVFQDIALVGFNDQIESSYYGLSSYHFDMTSQVMRMFIFLLYPNEEKRLRPAQGSEFLEEIAGFIVDRGSLGVSS